MEKQNGDVIWTNTNAEFPQVNYECFKCGERTEGFSICLKCNPQTYEVIGMSRDILTKEEMPKLAKEISDSLTKEFTESMIAIVETTWNAAIEAAAEKCKHSGYYEQIKELKI